MANQPGEFSDVARLTRLLHEGQLSRRDLIDPVPEPSA